MSWLTDLVETYDVCATIPGFIGRIDVKEFENGYRKQYRPLAPLYHDVIKCGYEVHIDKDGNYLTSFLVPRDNATTIIPCTPMSRARTGSAASERPQAIAERLDFIIKNGYDNKYMKQLGEWMDSDSFRNAAPEAKELLSAVASYLDKHTLKQDIEDNLTDDMKKDASPTGSVRFFVDGLPEAYGPADLSQNPLMWQLHIDRYREMRKGVEKKLCFATGTLQPPLTVGCKCILEPGDSAKLFPVKEDNDTPGTGYFTFRHSNIFLKPNDAFIVGEETAEKAQAMLRWLLDHQSWSILRTSTRKMLVWAIHSPDQLPIDDIYRFDSESKGENADVEDGENGEANDAADNVEVEEAESDFAVEDAVNAELDGDEPEIPMEEVILGMEKAKGLRKLSEGGWVKGFNDTEDDIIILMVDKPSVGRISIVGYQKMTKSQYYDCIMHWHASAGWGDTLAPSMRQAVMTAFGPLCYKNGKILQEPARAAQEVLRAINYGTPLPNSIATAAFMRTIRTTNWKMNGRADDVRKEWYRYQKQVERTCALMCKSRTDYRSEDLIMDTLDLNCKDRDYLYGRALALFDALERDAMHAQNRDFERPTNAYKHSVSFYATPARMTFYLMQRVNPYVKKNWPNSRYKYEQLNEVLSTINEVEAKDTSWDYMAAERPVGQNALLGYACQMRAMKEARIMAAKKKAEKNQQKKKDGE